MVGSGPGWGSLLFFDPFYMELYSLINQIDGMTDDWYIETAKAWKMKTLLIILLSLCVLILACQSKKANEINATVSLEERLKQLDSIKDSIEKRAINSWSKMVF